jgi:hypothetical protein
MEIALRRATRSTGWPARPPGRRVRAVDADGASCRPWELALSVDPRVAAVHWRLEDIDLAGVEADCIRNRDDLCLLVCSASLTESGTGMYTRNLLDYFAGDAEVCDWLAGYWEPEELQHGRALAAYVRQVWPEFDWDAAYAAFRGEYAALCTVDDLEPTRGQELVARCIVEMGTTTFYQALNVVCDEPVLRDLTSRIRNDEIQHYKHFYRFFLRYRMLDRLRRPNVLAAIWRRVAELRRSDSGVALRHAAAWRFRDREPQARLALVETQIDRLLATRYPVALAVRMTLKPLQLNAYVERLIEWPLELAARRLLRR